MLEKSLFSEYSDLASEWDYDRNEKLTPKTIAPHSNKKVFWRCSKGHSYECTPDKRGERGCPNCKAIRNRKAILCVETGKMYISMTSAVAHGYSASSLRACLQGKTETYKGMHWRYC